MFKINNRTVQNKRTGEKFGPDKIIAQYIIRIVQRVNIAEKSNRTCTIIQYPRIHKKTEKKYYQEIHLIENLNAAGN